MMTIWNEILPQEEAWTSKWPIIIRPLHSFVFLRFVVGVLPFDYTGICRSCISKTGTTELDDSKATVMNMFIQITSMSSWTIRKNLKHSWDDIRGHGIHASDLKPLQFLSKIRSVARPRSLCTCRGHGVLCGTSINTLARCRLPTDKCCLIVENVLKVMKDTWNIIGHFYNFAVYLLVF